MDLFKHYSPKYIRTDCEIQFLNVLIVLHILIHQIFQVNPCGP